MTTQTTNRMSKNKLAFLDKEIPKYYAPLGVIVLIAIWQFVCSLGPLVS